MRNQKSKRKNRGGAFNCKYPSGNKTSSSNGICPSGSIKFDNDNNQPNIKNTNQVIKVKSPVITCKRDNGDPKSFLVSELEKTTIKVDNKEEERPLCPKDYYFDSISKNPVAYQDLIEEEKAKQIMDDYKNATIIKPLEEETSGGKRKRTFRRRKQRKQRKTSKK
jgi:hypothetical protein